MCGGNIVQTFLLVLTTDNGKGVTQKYMTTSSKDNDDTSIYV